MPDHPDLYYFYESDFSKGNLVDFYNSLPNGKVQRIFVKAMGGLSNLDRDSTNVIQGYRGHQPNDSSGDSAKLEESNGLQQICFWWGVSKYLHLVPGGGTVVWIAARMSADTDWHSIYFDSETGEALSHDINEAAAKLNDIGLNHLRNSRFDKAVKYFENAYLHSRIKRCYDEYKENQKKGENEQKAQRVCEEGHNLFNQKRYAEAREKFGEAYSLSQVKNEYDKYETLRDKAAAERDAAALNAAGVRLLLEGKFREARDKCQQACDKTTVSSQYNEFKKNKDDCEVEIAAQQMSARGDELFKRGNFSEARQKYQEAADKSANTSQRSKYEENKLGCEAEIKAQQLNSQGNELFASGNFSGAHKKYQEAYQHSDVLRQYTVFEQNIEKAKAEMDAQELRLQGDLLFSGQRFGEARAIYQAAHAASKNGTQRDIYKAKTEEASTEAEAMELNKQGEAYIKEGRFEEAATKFAAAYQTSGIEGQQEIFQANWSRAMTKIDGEELFNRGQLVWNQAWQAENNGLFDVAETKFQESFTLFSQAADLVTSNKTYKNWKTASKMKIEGNQLFNLGLQLQEEANQLRQGQHFEAAREKYREAGASFQQGLTSSGDVRFNDCIEIVAQSLNETGEALRRINAEGSASIFAGLRAEAQSSRREIEAVESDERKLVQLVEVIDVKR